MKKIDFVIRPGFEGLEYIDKSKPRESKYFYPEWWKKIPSKMGDGVIPHTRTVKMCPSFADIYNEGFVIVAPCDIVLRYHEQSQLWEWETSMSQIKIEVHGNNQFVNWVDGNVKSIFKLPLPYAVFLPKGYNLRQVPLIYNYNPDWHVAYGVYRADQVPELTIQIMYTSDKKEILIKQGTPLCQMIPYKREKFTYSFVKLKEIHMRKIKAGWYRATSKFTFSHIKNTED